MPQKARKWYTQHSESYISSYPYEKLVLHSATHIEKVLDAIGRVSTLSGWQMRQAADAIRMLFCDRLKLPWACDFDWAGWKEDTVELEDSHRTVMRDYEAPCSLEMALRARVLASRKDVALGYGEMLQRNGVSNMFSPPLAYPRPPLG